MNELRKTGSDETPRVPRDLTPKNLNDFVLDTTPESTVATQKAEQAKKLEKRRMAQHLEKLVDRRDLVMQKFYRIREGLKAQNMNVHWLNLQLETIRKCNEESEKVYAEICGLTSREQREEHMREYLRCEDMYSALYVDIQTKMSQRKEEANQVKLDANAIPFHPQQPNAVNASGPHLQVPLPTFDGNLENWYSFKCMFRTIMSRYPNESPAIKLYHLKNSLIGKAAGKIDQDVINNNNYDTAWKMLEDTYEDERLIIDTHIDALLNLPRMTTESSEDLRKLIDATTKHVDALLSRELAVEGLAEMILINLISKRLDKDTRKLWESQLPKEELPSYTDLIDFLRERSRILQKLKGYSEQRAPVGMSKRGKAEQSLPAKNFSQTTKESCYCCNGDHLIYKCNDFRKLELSDRYSQVKKSGLCFNCLRRGHRTTDCKSEQSCKTCGRKHHSLLHTEKIEPSKSQKEDPKPSTSTSDDNNATNVQQSRSVNCSQSSLTRRQIVLSTAEVLVCGSGNSTWPCRALLDSASDSNVMTEKLAKKLNIQLEDVNIPISGLNNNETHVKFKVQTKIRSRVSTFDAILDFLVVPKIITNLPTVEMDIRTWPIPKGIALADPSFNIPDEIEMIIGAELFFDLLKEGRVRLGKSIPTLIDTQLGWIVSGPAPAGKKKLEHTCQVNVSNDDLNQTLTRFWELETCQEASPLTAAEHAVETHFDRTFTRNKHGRYTVRLPFNDRKSQLGDSFAMAKHRFDKLMRTFINESKKIRYTEFMAEYLALGHMVEVNDTPTDCYFLPHHAVYKETSSTTKIRVVFDASARTTTGFSLNDALEIGPTVQSDLVSIILRFCSHQVVLTADIPKMYRQVQVHENDRKYQRILWLNSENKLGIFELTTVTYGCASAPYLATKVLIQLATDEASELPLAANVIKNDSYIDDFLTGGQSAAEVIEVYRQLSEILKRGGFGVHKFCSNSEAVRNCIPAELHETQMNFEHSDINNTIKTLGLIWNPREDYFIFHVNSLDPKYESLPTKRSVLSDIGRLFDPLGFLGPILTTAKIQMQDLWRRGLDWDEALPSEELKMWTAFRQQLPLVNQMKKPRCVIENQAEFIELHGYSDASKKAYGAVLYTRCVSSDGKVSVRLVCSKSRVAPLKPSTIPRLELCAALLLAQLTKKTVSSMKIAFRRVTLWSDSQVVLNWLKKSPLALNQFVSNRVATIIELVPDYQWRYVASEQNPADIISRGTMPSDLLKQELWWKGSPMLWATELQPGIGYIELDDAELPEIKTATVCASVQQTPTIDFSRISNFRRLQRAWAYVLRFINNIRFKTRNTSPLSAKEMNDGLMIIVKLVQQETFKELFKVLSSGSKRGHEHSGLAPFIDQDGMIRVGGRLKHSSIPYDGKHQLLLPEKHHVTRILVRQLHEDYFHVGQRGLLSIVRERFWPVRIKQIIKQIIGKCYVCYRHNPRPVNQFMGDLPDYRVTPSAVFSNTGVDYAGPFILREIGRKTTTYKAYISIFVCLATKAIHMELVSNLTTDNFVAALQRFISKRGMISNMYSDNGTTFVGANHELVALRKLFEEQVHRDKLNDFCIGKGIQWHFIPPRSPHFGGIWEAGVKSAKYHMKRVVGETRLTYEEMTTFLAQTEAILNSRPLCPLSDDPNEVAALTPSHFLINRSALSIPEPSYKEIKVGRLSRWQHVQLMREHFWKRWSAEYLHHLQTRPKWHSEVINIKEGALVVLKDDNAPPNQWHLGRIIATHPGRDGIVRVVTVKTAAGEYRRATTKICLLPSVDSEESTGGE
ncbi:uncharacterized protein LOC131434098 [Malaya genurostris]|uniref:uncharacterized protein LOC131434098 n=1 Tax=Malaya genurostris TaxID=325434 RepID=UPI0026F3C8D3|nr:uncharacterized protein LOC131434098 [Malaya genurostris]